MNKVINIFYNFNSIFNNISFKLQLNKIYYLNIFKKVIIF